LSPTFSKFIVTHPQSSNVPEEPLSIIVRYLESHYACTILRYFINHTLLENLAPRDNQIIDAQASKNPNILVSQWRLVQK